MAEYIKREDVLALTREIHVKEVDYRTMHIDPGEVRELPAADVAPVRHGRWQITDAYPHNVYCSECHKRFAQTHWAVWEDGSLSRAYCPNCGAKMDMEYINEKEDNEDD